MGLIGPGLAQMKMAYEYCRITEELMNTELVIDYNENEIQFSLIIMF